MSLRAISTLPSEVRFRLGSGFFRALDFLLLNGWFPFHSRFPVGISFTHDLTRFLGEPPKLVLDVGANVGQTARAFSRAWPKASIHSFEPVGSTYNTLIRNCAHFLTVRCHHCALGSVDSQVSIVLQQDSELNSLRVPIQDAGSHAVEQIIVRRLDTMSFELAFTSVDLLKIDAEGFELEVLRGAAELLRQRRVRSIFAECRFARTQANQVLFEDLDRTLVAAGFLFSGFYQFFRWGPSKAYAGFANGLWILEK